MDLRIKSANAGVAIGETLVAIVYSMPPHPLVIMEWRVQCVKNMLKTLQIFNCLVEVLVMDKVKCKLDSEVYGVMFVIPTGIYMMLQWHVVNWDITEQWWLQLHLPSGVILHKDCGLTMSDALGKKTI
jgi:hypothetical protein